MMVIPNFVTTDELYIYARTYVHMYVLVRVKNLHGTVGITLEHKILAYYA